MLKGGASPDDLAAIAELLRKHGASYVAFESNADILGTFQALFEATLRDFFLEPNEDTMFPAGWKCSVEGIHATGQKELRIINALEPVTSTHRLIVDPQVVMPIEAEDRDYDFQYQFTRLTSQRGALRPEDKIDALAGAVALFSSSLRQRTSDAAERQRERHVDARIADHRQRHVRSTPAPSRDSTGF